MATAELHRWAWPVIVAVLASSLGCAPKKPACEPVAKVEERWTSEAMALIDSGACEKYDPVETCPAFKDLQLDQALRQAKADSECSTP